MELLPQDEEEAGELQVKPGTEEHSQLHKTTRRCKCASLPGCVLLTFVLCLVIFNVSGPREKLEKPAVIWRPHEAENPAEQHVNNFEAKSSVSGPTAVVWRPHEADPAEQHVNNSRAKRSDSGPLLPAVVRRSHEADNPSAQHVNSSEAKSSEQHVKNSVKPKSGITCKELHPSIKFYIYNLDASLNTDLVACYKEYAGVDIFDDFTEEKGQNTADIWMHELLENHRSRTMNLREAQFFYIPFYGFLSSFFAGFGAQSISAERARFATPWGCKGKTHWDRVRELAAFLSNQPMFQQHPQRHLMTVSFWGVAQDTNRNWWSDPWAPPCVVVADLFEKLQRSVLFVYEEKFTSMRSHDEYKNWHGNLVTLPYVAKPSLVNSEPTRTLGHRNYSFFFKGTLWNPNGETPGMGYRSKLAWAFKKEPGSLIVDTQKHFTGNLYERGLHSSNFCLVFAGDTPTSGRLFDSIAAGCIPLILSDEITLPFADQLNWTQFSVHPHTASVLEGQTSGPAAMLERMPNETLQRMQQAVLQVRSNFIYGYGSPYNFSWSGGQGTLVDCALQEAVKRMGIHEATLLRH